MIFEENHTDINGKPEEELEKLPADFRSRTCIERNDAEPVPMMKKTAE